LSTPKNRAAAVDRRTRAAHHLDALDQIERHHLFAAM